MDVANELERRIVEDDWPTQCREQHIDKGSVGSKIVCEKIREFSYADIDKVWDPVIDAKRARDAQVERANRLVGNGNAMTCAMPLPI